MTTRANRLIAVSIGRLSPTAEDVDSGVLSDEIFGSIHNVAGGEMIYPHNAGFGPAGPDQYWNGTFEISALTFDLYDASQQPESLGPVDVYLEVNRTWSSDGAAIVTGKRRYVGKFQTNGTGTWDRTTDSPRSMTFQPFRRIDGGNATRDAMAKDLAALYADTRTGELLTRENGTGSSVDHYALIRTAHGV